MKEIMDGFEGVSAKLQEGVDWAIAGAKSAFEKAKPYIEDGIEMAKDGAQNLYERAKPKLDEFVERVNAQNGEMDESNAESVSDVREEISREVDEQVSKIRQSAVTPTPFTEYIRETYGKKND